MFPQLCAGLFCFFSGISELFVKLKGKLMTWETLFFHNCLSSRSRLHISVIKVSPANKLADSLHWSAISASFMGKLIHCIPANLPLRMQEGINTQSSFVFLKIRFSRGKKKKERKGRTTSKDLLLQSSCPWDIFMLILKSEKLQKPRKMCCFSALTERKIGWGDLKKPQNIHKLKQKKANHELKVFVNLPFIMPSSYVSFLLILTVYPFKWSINVFTSDLQRHEKDNCSFFWILGWYIPTDFTFMSFKNPLSESMIKQLIGKKSISISSSHFLSIF